ncbi:serine threonine kinase kin4 [Trichoderma cornu-damae]|uniref:non-specific serine/threonine protein kinase n=1 Tax=Trichoderma cornu-damae TaxID=654480 RepID=A0A9P8QSZ7_9HYPO|nr:serine threonine kinase kin4 [Trichoderma cornu-damae]
MSSAALQTAPPHQPTALSSSLPSPSSRQYTQSHSSSNREIHNAHQSASSTPPSSRRPPSRKSSGHGAPLPSDPGALAISRIPTSATRAADQHSRADRLSSAPAAPPRTSSSNPDANQGRGNQSSENMNSSPRRGHTDGSRIASRGDANGAADHARTKRAQNYHMPQDSAAAQVPMPSPRGGHAAEPPSSIPIPIRTHQTTITNSKPSREASESLHRVISNGEEANGRGDYHSLSHDVDPAAPPPVVSMNAGSEERRGGRSRHDHSRSNKATTKFGDFILGNTIGEGEFGKVKLGWKQDSSVQVAIKLIKRDTVGHNPSRLAKIKREVTILRGIHHPNIVRLIDMVETDRYIGIILEYASGGELFDYILNHRYLKDNSARRLFSQLVSGVGYLHKKGIVHRDLKLENLLLDRNRNIIITDFGFANTFDPHDELTEEEELNLSDREYVKRLGIDKVKPNGMRKGDLMQTSCGSPCYAAPELVVSDSLYTGRKVDVWSCGVILYAMLAGYLPFDDDPANPEGDNINLLYKYIVTTPLTFPEYVTPHARDLLRRILVPNPRKRADLFEVARHSWLSEYAHVVEFITSSTTSPSEVQSVSATGSDYAEAPMVTRSASVRDAPKQKSPQPTAVGGLAKTHGKIDSPTETAQRTSKDAKRRTVQVEYVAPVTQTQRGGTEAEVTRHQVPPTSRHHYETAQEDLSLDDRHISHSRPQSKKGPAVAQTGGIPQLSRPPRDVRSTSDNTYAVGIPATTARPRTGNSMQSATSLGLQTGSSYGQPVPPAIADTNVQGRIQQPSNANDEEADGRTSTSVPSKFARMSGFHEPKSSDGKGHKRSNTIGEIGSKLLGRSGSMFARKGKKAEQPAEKSKKYPPISMANTGMVAGDEPRSRPSIDSKASRRSFTLGLGKKRSGSINGSQDSIDKKERRRFSLLPASFSLKSFGAPKEFGSASPSEADLPIQNPRAADLGRSVTSHGGSTPFFDNAYDGQPLDTTVPAPIRQNENRHLAPADAARRANAVPPYIQQGTHLNSASETSVDMRQPPVGSRQGPYQYGYTQSEGFDGRGIGASRGVLQKSHKRFTDAYDQGDYRGHEGSSGAAKRVMDFFRRRGKARGGDER